jgi:hypothetical protein
VIVESRSRLQFSLTALLVLVTLAAVVVASISELPEWIGAPVLALIATAVTAVVITAALQSKGYLRTFCVGAAFPLVMLLVQTSIVMVALVKGIAEQEPLNINMRMMQFYEPNYEDQRVCYRWAAACSLACAPLIGLVCVSRHCSWSSCC